MQRDSLPRGGGLLSRGDKATQLASLERRARPRGSLQLHLQLQYHGHQVFVHFACHLRIVPGVTWTSVNHASFFRRPAAHKTKALCAAALDLSCERVWLPIAAVLTEVFYFQIEVYKLGEGVTCSTPPFLNTSFALLQDGGR